MESPSQRRACLMVVVAACLLLGCGVKPAPTEEEAAAAALFRRGPPSVIRECNRLIQECDRLFRPGRFRDNCVREVLHGECGRLPPPDAGRDTNVPGKDAASDAKSGQRDAAPDVPIGHVDGGVDRHVDSGAGDLRTVTIDGAVDFCPIITSLTGPTLTAIVGQPVTLIATAFDPNAGDTLTFDWFLLSSVPTISLDPEISLTGTTMFTCLAAGPN